MGLWSKPSIQDAETSHRFLAPGGSMGTRFCLLPLRDPWQVSFLVNKEQELCTISLCCTTASLEEGSGLQQIVISSSLTGLFGVAAFTLCYKFYLRRRLIRKFLKEDWHKRNASVHTRKPPQYRFSVALYLHVLKKSWVLRTDRKKRRNSSFISYPQFRSLARCHFRSLQRCFGGSWKWQWQLLLKQIYERTLFETKCIISTDEEADDEGPSGEVEEYSKEAQLHWDAINNRSYRWEEREIKERGEGQEGKCIIPYNTDLGHGAVWDGDSQITTCRVAICVCVCLGTVGYILQYRQPSIKEGQDKKVAMTNRRTQRTWGAKPIISKFKASNENMMKAVAINKPCGLLAPARILYNCIVEGHEKSEKNATNNNKNYIPTSTGTECQCGLSRQL